MAEMTREPETHSLYPELKPLSAAQIKENNDFLATMQRNNQPKAPPKVTSKTNHPGAGLLAQVAMKPVPKNPVSTPVTTTKPQPPPTSTKPTVVPIPAERTAKPKEPQPKEQELDLDGNPYPTEETGEVCSSPIEQDLSKLHWKDRPVENFVLAQTQIRKVGTTVKHNEKHERPVLVNCQSEDDFAGFTADPVLNKMCCGEKFQLKNHKQKGVTKFEVRVNDQSGIIMEGSEKDQMLNGFSLKVLTLGIVKTRFSFSLMDTQGATVFEAYRGIGTSTFVDVDLTYFKDKIKCGRIQPTGFNINRISYHIYDDKKEKVFTVQGGILRGLFSDGWEIVRPDGKKIGNYGKGVLIFTKPGVPGTAGYVTMKQKILAIAACQLIQLSR